MSLLENLRYAKTKIIKASDFITIEEYGCTGPPGPGVSIMVKAIKQGCKFYEITVSIETDEIKQTKNLFDLISLSLSEPGIIIKYKNLNVEYIRSQEIDSEREKEYNEIIQKNKQIETKNNLTQQKYDKIMKELEEVAYFNDYEMEIKLIKHISLKDCYKIISYKMSLSFYIGEKSKLFNELIIESNLDN